MPKDKNGQEHGVTITGEFLGLSEGKPYADRNQQSHVPGIIDLLVGRYVERIEFNDLAEAKSALGIAGDMPPPEQVAFLDSLTRQTVSLSVRPTGPWDAGAKRWGRVSYRGRSD